MKISRSIFNWIRGKSGFSPSTFLTEVKFFPEEWMKIVCIPKFAWGSSLNSDLWIQSENK